MSKVTINENNLKTTTSEKIGYGFAALGDTTGYGLIGVFLLFFLTTIAGISPAVSGTIMAVGSVWSAVFNPVMGYFADTIHSKFGKRRLPMLVFCIPMAISIFLLFTDLNIPMGVKPVYYGALLMLYWTFYVGFFVPYNALGLTYTSDYDDRTVLRSFVSLFNMFGTMTSMVMPTVLVEMFEGFGFTPAQAWSITGALLGAVAMIAIIITIIAAKDKDIREEHYEKTERESFRTTFAAIFRVYFELLKLKPMKWLVLASLFSLISYAVIMSDIVYYFTYNKGFSSVEISGCLFLRTAIGTAFIPVINKIIIATDKRETLIGCYIFAVIGMFFVKFVDLGSAEIFIYIFFVMIATSVYWQIMPGVYYDVCEFDKIVNGQNRSAAIVSFEGLVNGVAAGVGGQLLGLILDVAGFDGEVAVQTETALAWIENAGTILPTIFLIAACFALYKFPINKKSYNKMFENRPFE